MSSSLGSVDSMVRPGERTMKSGEWLQWRRDSQRTVSFAWWQTQQ